MKYKIILFLMVISLFSSILIMLPKEIKGMCVQNTCESVTDSQYGKFLGISNSYYGVVIFSFLAIVIFLHINKPTKIKKQIISIGVITGSIIASYFIYLQKFVLKQYCTYCLIIDISLLIALIILVFAPNKKIA
ncbi:vitamin K epoxide reductase family protein [Candidatus Pacearchaeota archaeon]|nr:vitamin K epoxide reductase family protein [Candidatus Pacearchaeota archaeon]